MSDSYVYTIVKIHDGQWDASTEFRGRIGLTCLSRKSYSPFDALRQLMQATGELEPIEAKIEEGEA